MGVFIGCDPPPPPAFRLNMVEMVSDDSPTPPEYQQAIADILRGMFGTPDDPYVLPETGLDLKKLQMAAGPAWTDQQGVNFGLYRKHCVHCHGITGDGRGPTARFLNPYPRDYRAGVYKFKSTYRDNKPTDEDLKRVLINGVPGTSMPSFSLLPESEIEALVEYVKYLSMRGEMETALIQFAFLDLGPEDVLDEDGELVRDEEGEPVTQLIPMDPTEDPYQREVIQDILAEIADRWKSANAQVIIPEEEQIPDEDRSLEEIMASVEKGRELFYGKRANCIQCHGPTALGDGQQNDFDDWTKAHKQLVDSVTNNDGEAGDEGMLAHQRKAVAESLYPIRNAIPRNLREGVYRGGRRRIDMFWRMYAGIAGTPMPGIGPASPGAQGTLTQEEMWNIVDYVMSLPYEAVSQPMESRPVNLEEVY